METLNNVGLHERVYNLFMQFLLLYDGKQIEPDSPFWPIVKEGRKIRAADMEQEKERQESRQ